MGIQGYCSDGSTNDSRWLTGDFRCFKYSNSYSSFQNIHPLHHISTCLALAHIPRSLNITFPPLKLELASSLATIGLKSKPFTLMPASLLKIYGSNTLLQNTKFTTLSSHDRPLKSIIADAILFSIPLTVSPLSLGLLRTLLVEIYLGQSLVRILVGTVVLLRSILLLRRDILEQLGERFHHSRQRI